MKSKNKKDKINLKDQRLQLFYLIAVFLFCIKFFLEKFEGFKIYDNIIAVAFCLLFIVKMVFQQYNKKQLALVSICGILSTITAFITKENVIFYTFLMIFASQKIELKKVIKVCLYTFTTMLYICTMVYLIRYILGASVPLTYRPDGSVRLTFYMNHPNIFAGMVLWCSAMFMYLKNESLDIVHYTLLTILNILTFLLTDSRTSFLAFIFFAGVFIVLNKKSISEKALKKIGKYSIVTLMITTIAISLLYIVASNSMLLTKLNDFLSQRVYLSSYAFKKYGITLIPRCLDFTEKVPWITGRMDELFVDSIYIRTIIKSGILYSIYFIFVSINLVNKKTEKNDIPVILLFAVVGILEKYICFSVIGFPLMFFGNYLWSLEYENK